MAFLESSSATALSSGVRVCGFSLSAWKHLPTSSQERIEAQPSTPEKALTRSLLSLSWASTPSGATIPSSSSSGFTFRAVQVRTIRPPARSSRGASSMWLVAKRSGKPSGASSDSVAARTGSRSWKAKDGRARILLVRIRARTSRMAPTETPLNWTTRQRRLWRGMLQIESDTSAMSGADTGRTSPAGVIVRAWISSTESQVSS